MTDGRIDLPVGTTVKLEQGDTYRITGEPIGRSGGSILYPVRKLLYQDGHLQTGQLLYVLKECYPISPDHSYIRNQYGQIIPENPSDAEQCYLRMAQLMQVEEGNISQSIFRTASRILPIRSISGSAFLTLPGKTGAMVCNTFTLMDSLREKGRSLTEWLREKRRFTPPETFRIIQQLLFALQEVHQAGYLHLDIQDGNIFLRGTLEQKNELVTLIDFGCARKMTDRKTAPVSDRIIFTTQGFCAPEILLHNDGNLQLGPEADIYSVGCLIWYMLTGMRANVRELAAKQNGVYLQPNQLARIKCPKHLTDSMQRILAQALATEPENRYSSTEDMLKDVTDLAEALQAGTANLRAVKYDAFICYQHNPIDSSAARALQRALENYRAPNGVAEKKRPFSRVFVDEGELSSCADFGRQIREALKNSGWLIVICSPDTPHSPWVRKEIDTFLKYHDRSRILAVLLRGSPEESFPPQLKGNANGTGEVLAAHALSRTPQEAAKQLRGNALLKIAAPMLFTTYDTLKQRQKIYRCQKLAVAAASAFLLCGSFAAYAANRGKVIADQAVRIEEEHRTALRKEAQVLLEQAERKLEDHDPYGAMECLLPVLTAENQDPALMTEAEYLLGKNLGIYETPLSALYTAAPAGLADTGCREFFLDGAGQILFAWSNGEKRLELRKTKTLQHTEIITLEEGISYTSGDLLLPEEHALILRTDSAVVCVDYLSGELLWSVPAEDTRSVCLSRDKQQLFVLRSGYRSDTICLDILSAKTGELQQQISFRLRENHYISDSERIVSEGQWLTFTAEGDPPAADHAYSDTLYLLNLETGTCSLLTEEGTAIQSVEIMGDQVALMRWNGDSSHYRQCTMWLESYDCFTQKRIWSLEQHFYPRTAGGDSIEQIPGSADILFSFADRCLLADRKTGRVIHEYEMSAPVADVICYTDDFRVLSADGSLSLASYDTDSLLTLQLLDRPVTAAQSSGNDFYIQSDSDCRIRKFTWGKYDPQYVSLYEGGSKEWFLGETYRDQDKLNAIRLEQANRIRWVDPVTGQVRDYDIPVAYGFSQGYCSDGEQVYWNSRSGETFYRLDMHSGAVSEIRKPSELSDLFAADSLFADNCLLILAEEYTETEKYISIYSWNLVTGSFRKQFSQPFGTGCSVVPDSFEKNGSLGFFAVRNSGLLPSAIVRVNLMTGDTTVAELDSVPEKTADSYRLTLCYHWSNEGDLLAFGYGPRAYLMEKAGTLLNIFSVDSNVAGTVFSPDAQYLYVFEENGRILKYRISDGCYMGSVALRDYCEADGRIRGDLYLNKADLQWAFIGNHELLVCDPTSGGFLLDISGEELRMKAVLPKCIGYDSVTDTFLVTDANYLTGELSSVGMFRRYQTEDLIQIAQSILIN